MVVGILVKQRKKGVVDEVQCRSGGHTYGFLLGMPSLQDNTAVSTKLSKESGHYCYRTSRMENHFDHTKGREHTTFKYKVVKNYSNVIERRKPLLNKCIRWKEIHYSHKKSVQTT